MILSLEPMCAPSDHPNLGLFPQEPADRLGSEAPHFTIDPASGALLQRLDADRRWHRWLFAGLHRIDFAQWLRVRPLWDMIVLGLLLGGAGVSLTGVYLALRRLRGDIASLLRLFRAPKLVVRPDEH